MKTFFAFIRQFNSLFLFGILASFLLLVALGIWSSLEDHRIDVVTVSNATGSKVDMHFRLVEFKDIPGANAQMLKLTATRVEPGFAYSDYKRDTRNILFLAGDERKARWLFLHQNNVIHTAGQLHSKDETENSPSRETPTKALYIEYSDKDTNDDGEISEDDEVSLGLSKPDGEGFATVLTGIDQLYSVSMLGNQSISILYRTGKMFRHALYSVATLTKVADREIVAIPDIEFRD